MSTGWTLFLIIVIVIFVALGLLTLFIFLTNNGGSATPIAATTTPINPDLPLVNPLIPPENKPGSSNQLSSKTSGSDTLVGGGNVVYTAAPMRDLTVYVPESPDNTTGTLIKFINTAPVESSGRIIVAPGPGVSITGVSPTFIIPPNDYGTLVATSLNTYRFVPSVDPILYVFSDIHNIELDSLRALYEITKTNWQYIITSPTTAYFRVNNREDRISAQPIDPPINGVFILGDPETGAIFSQSAGSTTRSPIPPAQIVNDRIIPAVARGGSPLVSVLSGAIQTAIDRVGGAISSVTQAAGGVGSTISDVSAIAAEIRASLPAIRSLIANAETTLSTVNTALSGTTASAASLLEDVRGTVAEARSTVSEIRGAIPRVTNTLILVGVGLAIFFIVLAIGGIISTVANYRIATTNKL